MKAITVLFSIFIILSYIGCGENVVSPADTIQNPEINKGLQSRGGFFKDEIPICCETYEPLTGNCKVMGKVTYIHEILGYTADSVMIKINLEMDSELCTKLMNPIRYAIYGNSEDVYNLLIDGKILIDKTYEISHRSDLILRVQYLVTTESVSIMEMQLLPIVTVN